MFIFLTPSEISEIKELIFNKIDQVDGFDNLDDDLKILLEKLNS